MLKISPTQLIEPCLIAKDGALVAPNFDDVFSSINEDVATLNMPKHREPQTVQEGHRLEQHRMLIHNIKVIMACIECIIKLEIVLWWTVNLTIHHKTISNKISY